MTMSCFNVFPRQFTEEYSVGMSCMQDAPRLQVRHELSDAAGGLESLGFVDII